MSTWPNRIYSFCSFPGAARRQFHQAGFTLLELLVVLTIVSLLAVVAGPQVVRYLGKAKSETARLQVRTVATALDLYLLDNGSYPPQRVGLSALLQAPAGAPRWKGPYLKKVESVIDPWGRPLNYRIPGRHGDYDLYSLGRDNAEGGTGEDQDITNW
ncbi:MAG TPA: type II secretion system major pseudopilin GspG [Hyphomicrobiaceae bacterium]|jgi:general secretion pathway protein G|nr:type II secretion system major pseudopilin GspG [Hyphomicrobiaceae bacterium]